MSARRANPYVFMFMAVDSANPPNGLAGLSWSASDVKLSKDGATFASGTNAPAYISGVTGACQVTLTSAEMDCGSLFVSIEKAGMDPVRCILLTTNDPTGTVVTDGSNTASTFKTDRAEATNDYWKDALILFVSGSLIGQSKRIQSYNGSTKFITAFAAFTAAPANGDRFVLVNR